MIMIVFFVLKMLLRLLYFLAIYINMAILGAVMFT